MTALLDELKTRARLRLNAARREEAGAADVRLRHCLNQVAREVGFVHWEHARAVLGGAAVREDDMGTFWHAPRTGILLNLWLAKYEEAQAALEADPRAFLLPYRRQFMVVQADFIQELGVDASHPAWAETAHDLVAAYGGSAWLALAGQRLKAPRDSFISS
ncbi:hypothetical protein [Polaromonas sp.]|uniref:hypothetical protein n=1 Tax=Polaromonas sp. TaxID=1869339 RepID=UPI0032654673